MSGKVHFLSYFQTNAIHFRWLFYFNIFLSRKKEAQYFYCGNSYPLRFDKSSKHGCGTRGRRNDVPHWFIARTNDLTPTPVSIEKKGQLKTDKNL
jgi:hypothetical protein